jgi:dinuclear metal center YbgI/SA1388 family protein
MTATVRECVEVLADLYDPAWAQPWDAVGLSVGDPAARVEKVLFAVDPTVDVAAEAVAVGAGLLVTHHPLFLRGVHGVAETTPGGKVVGMLARSGAALFTAHTNADVANPGVSDALAAAIGLVEVGPIGAAPDGPPVRPPAGPPVRPPAGPPVRPPAGSPDPGAGPAACRGLGRVGVLPGPETLAAFCERVAAGLPATAGGVRATGDPDRLVRRIAVCGGSGGELVGAAAAAGADVLVTADARHHHTLDAVWAYDTAIVDVAHWASEWPWLADAAGRLRAGLSARGRTVVTTVSTRVTDPWRWHVPSSDGVTRV